MNINNLTMSIELVRNRLRDMSNEINRICERGEMINYINDNIDREHPVIIGNCTYMIPSAEIKPVIENAILRDSVTLCNYENMLKRALEAISDSSGPT